MKKKLLSLLVLLRVFTLTAQDGFPDASFGSNGFVTLPDFTDVAFQSDGKMVGVRSMNGDFVVSRYQADGMPDPSFGTGGTVITDLGIVVVQAGLMTTLPADDWAYSVAIQPDGKIVVMGHTRYVAFPGGFFQLAMAVARYNSNGTLDGSFGRGGVLRSDLNQVHRADVVYDVAIGNGGRILTTYRGVAPGGSSAVLRIFDANGLPVPSPGTLGSCCYYGEVPTILDVQANGKIVVGGQQFNLFPVGHGLLFLTRLNADGTNDASFGTGGTVTLPAYNTAIGVAGQPDGKLVVIPSPTEVIRLNVDGSRDASFGSGGIVHSPFEISEVIVQDDGKIITGGNYTEAGNNGHFIMARYNSDGSFDASFAYGGMTAIFLGGTRKLLEHMAIANNHLYAYGSGNLAAFSLAPPRMGSVANRSRGNEPDEFNPTGKLSVRTLSNPSTTHFNLRLQGSSTEPVHIRVVDATGKTIEWKRKLAPNTVQRLGDSYPAGLYYAEVMQGREKVTVKLLKGGK